MKKENLMIGSLILISLAMKIYVPEILSVILLYNFGSFYPFILNFTFYEVPIMVISYKYGLKKGILSGLLTYILFYLSNFKFHFLAMNDGKLLTKRDIVFISILVICACIPHVFRYIFKKKNIKENVVECI